MSIYDEKLWEHLNQKAQQEDEGHPADLRISSGYLKAVKDICDFAVGRAKLIRDTFPMFTLHDETHIINVMRIMAELLGEDGMSRLTRDETAMLMLAACCHDIGMSYSKDERQELLEDWDRFEEYLIRHPEMYVKVYAKGKDQPEVSDDIIRSYLRSIHHERVEELLYKKGWPSTLAGKVNCGDLIQVCQSHGKDISSLDKMRPSNALDMRFCAVLLRLADILDFDTSRAPLAVYEYCGFNKKSDPESVISRDEWDKHRSSLRFDFEHLGDRSVPYDLPYYADCYSMQVEQAINSYLDWVDKELYNCIAVMRRYKGKWDTFVLPAKVDRNITANGYVSGQYSLSLDQSQVLNLLVGDNLYTDPAVFVRELIQNAIDAVRTRERMDKELPGNWSPRINIRTWMDEEGYHWFRIEDNGTGMTEDIIRKYLLRVGNSYYTSDQFRQDKIRCRVDESYTPISRFGIGILSCFMGNTDQNQVEISTKRFRTGEDFPAALRLQMHGLSGYYALYSKQDASHHPGPMKGCTPEEKREYLTKPGTVVAVRTNLYQDGRYKGFREIVDKYVVYPPVPIHYEGPEGPKDYLTEKEFMAQVHSVNHSEDLEKDGVITFELKEEHLEKIKNECPELTITETPAIHLKCVALDRYTSSNNLSGAMVVSKVTGSIQVGEICFGNKRFNMIADIRGRVDKKTGKISIGINLNPRDREEAAFDEFKNKVKQYRAYSSRVWGFVLNVLDLPVPPSFIYEVTEYWLKGREDDERWRAYICNQYKITSDQMDDIINRYNEHFKQNNLSKSEKEAIESYESKPLQWDFDCCNLYELPWYESLFLEVTKRTGHHDNVAHNGILCGEAARSNWSNYEFVNYRDIKYLGMVLLLRDSYRPEIGIARNSIRQLPLEALIDIELIFRKLKDFGYDVRDIFDRVEITNNCNLSAREYLKIAEKRPDFIERITIPTVKGNLSIEQILSLIKEDKKAIEISNRINLNERIHEKHVDNLYMAFLQSKNALCVHGDYKYASIQAKDMPPVFPFDHLLDFAPAFFLLSDTDDCTKLASKWSYARYTCNVNHRFSRFLIENAKLLKKYSAGVLHEFLRSLSEDSGDDLIKRVNELLAFLRALPGTPVSVPDELFLTDKDLS